MSACPNSDKKSGCHQYPICKEKFAHINERLEKGDAEFEKFNEAIQAIREAVVEMKTVSKQTSQTLQAIQKKIEERELASETQKSFWDTEAGKRVPLLAFLLCVIVVAGLLGNNILETLQAAGKLTPVK